MENNELFSKAEQFFKKNPSCSDALAQLKPGTEIAINLAKKIECSLSYQDEKVVFKEAKAIEFDVEFILNTESIRRLCELSNLSIGEVGIEFVKEILLGHIEVKKHSGIFDFLKNGYVKIIRLAGPEFLSFLATHGLGSLQKIVGFVRKM